MRPSILWVIVQKELKETLRDRKTLFQMFVLPLLVYPLLVLGAASFQRSTSEARVARPVRVAVWGELPPPLATELGSPSQFVLLPWSGAPADVRSALESGAAEVPLARDDDAVKAEGDAKAPKWVEPENPTLLAARALVARREADAVLVPWPGFRAALDEGRLGEVSVYFDSVRPDSVEARDRVERALRHYREEVVDQRLHARGLEHAFAAAIRITPRNLAPEQRRMADLLSGMMPFLLVIMSLIGALYPAIDLTAGEKERGTMQTLLCAPVRRIEIIFGKFLAVWAISLLMALTNMVSMSLTLARAFHGEATVAPSVYALTFVMLLPVTFMVSAIFLAVAAFARDFKDGQNLLVPVYLPLSMIAGVTVLPGVELDPYTAFVPLVNISLLIKASFLSEAKPDLVFLALGSSVIYAALALVLAARVFEREQVLLGGGSLRAIFRRDGATQQGPTPAFSFATASAILVLGFYGSLAFSRWGTLASILGQQYGLMLAPTVGAAIVAGFALRPTFGLRLPSARSTLAALLVGPSIGVLVVAIVHYVAPVPESFGRAMAEIVLLGGRPLPVLILVIAITPAICEELLFRGLVFSGFRRLGPTAAVILSALLFAFAHASIYRIVPTLSLGLVLGYIRRKSGSVVPGMIVHATNNGLAVALLYTHRATPLLQEDQPPSMTLVAGALAMCAVAAALLRSLPEPESDSHPTG